MNVQLRNRALTMTGAALLLGVMGLTGPRGAAAQAPGDYLVTVGKRTVWASQVTPPASVRQQSDRSKGSEGQFVQVGKSQVWVANVDAERLGQTATVASSEKDAKAQPRSRGYFVHRGKAIIWVETGDAQANP